MQISIDGGKTFIEVPRGMPVFVRNIECYKGVHTYDARLDDEGVFVQRTTVAAQLAAGLNTYGFIATGK
ncbi:MAG: hypothetical protein [Bacteriophage sp.]|nr:MAG: hypothetical protein [Bacteriophage sp.]